MAGHRATSIYGTDLAYIHDIGYGDFARDSAPGLLRWLKQCDIHGGLVVDVGCGSGVWAQQLARAGYDVSGLDVSPAMVKLARERCEEGDFQVGSVWSHRLPRCRAITALGEVLSYRSAGPRVSFDLPQLLRKFHDALQAPGLLVFDVAEIGLDRERAPTFFADSDWACLIRFEYDARRDRLTRHITTFRKADELYRRSTETHELQLYSAADIAQHLRDVGFRIRQVRRYGQHDLLAGRVGFFARKPATHSST